MPLELGLHRKTISQETPASTHSPSVTASARATDAPPGLGVYIHIPFCASRCDYCAFATWTDKSDLIDAYVDACLIDIERARRVHLLEEAETIFIGGGTPSLIGSKRLSRLIRAIDLASGGEITVECNPESTDLSFFSELRSAGVTRISLGVQSLHPHVLKGLGRIAEPERALRAMEEICAAGFETFNMDVIFGGFGETDDDFATSLQAILDHPTPPPHVSAYALAIERGTPISFEPARQPDDDVLADRYELCDHLLSASGRSWYEVSNWALAGHECRHNANCWQQGEYVAIGCAAHGHRNGTRTVNAPTPERYIEIVAEGRSPAVREERLSERDRRIEGLELQLRTRRGVQERFLPFDEVLEGLIEYSGGRAILTARGRLLCNEVSMRLCPDFGEMRP